MKINIIETITNTFDANRKLIKSRKNEIYAITPEEGKALRNKKTGSLFRNLITVSTEKDVHNYEEINDPALE